MTKETILDTSVEQEPNKECDVKIVSAETLVVPPVIEIASTDVQIYEEETRMSADTSSRAQTPAKQVGICRINVFFFNLEYLHVGKKSVTWSKKVLSIKSLFSVK